MSLITIHLGSKKGFSSSSKLDIFQILDDSRNRIKPVLHGTHGHNSEL